MSPDRSTGKAAAAQPAAPVQALLFDLGGVLIDIDFGRAFEHWQTLSTLSLQDLTGRFAFDTAHEQHERGEISAADYFLQAVRVRSPADVRAALGALGCAPAPPAASR